MMSSHRKRSPDVLDDLPGTTVSNHRLLTRTSTLSKLIPNRKSVRDHFHDYCSSTSIHGVKYLGERDRPFGERVCWVMIFVFCVAGNGYLIQKVWTKWHESPVIVSFAETTTPVWQVPFPAITVCSEVKSRATLFNFSHYIEILNTTDEDVKKKMGDISLLCDPHISIDDGSDEADNSTVDFFIEVAPPFNDTIWICKWKDYLSENCTTLFTQIITDEGVCYTFNMLDKGDLFRGDPFPQHKPNWQSAEGWSLDTGYTPEAPLDTYPSRALAAGARAGLSFVMKAQKKDADYYCRGPVQGFKVLLHNPAEFPLVGERYFRTPFNQEVTVVIQPNIMTTAESLRSYSPTRRQCYFQSERYLQFFKVYTQRNCELECLTNYTLKTCGCIAFYMPRTGNTKICGPAKKNCTTDAGRELLFKEISSSSSGQIAGTCHCLPACTSLQYNAETSQANYEASNVLSVYDHNLTDIDGMAASRISVFFKDMQFTTSRRSELFGIVDFLANCGGLLGLFCGVSLLSIVELVYYITLRFWSNLKKNNKSKEKYPEHESDKRIF